jgi:hypothetical protein
MNDRDASVNRCQRVGKDRYGAGSESESVAWAKGFHAYV